MSGSLQGIVKSNCRWNSGHGTIRPRGSHVFIDIRIFMPLYDLPLWVGDFTRFPPEGISGAGWKFSSAEIPYFEYGSKEWRHHFREMRKKYPQYGVHSVSNGAQNGVQPWIAPQVIAEATSRTAAQKAFELLTTAMSIADGSNFFELDDAIVVPRNRRQLEDLSPEDVEEARTYTLTRSNVIFACRFAAALSRRTSLSYAAFKLMLSYQISTTHWMNLHPKYSPKEFGVSKSLSDHVRMASAITLAYSAIEEMQLEPRPIKNKPVKDRGIWDSDALADLQERLQIAHADLSQSLTWTIRGSRTRIHDSPRAPQGTKLSWTKGVVRDRAVKVEDALVAASWLRSKCSTHKYTRQTQSISIYDVVNVQHLARRLLLESASLWKHLLQSAQSQ